MAIEQRPDSQPSPFQRIVHRILENTPLNTDIYEPSRTLGRDIKAAFRAYRPRIKYTERERVLQGAKDAAITVDLSTTTPEFRLGFARANGPAMHGISMLFDKTRDPNFAVDRMQLDDFSLSIRKGRLEGGQINLAVDGIPRHAVAISFSETGVPTFTAYDILGDSLSTPYRPQTPDNDGYLKYVIPTLSKLVAIPDVVRIATYDNTARIRPQGVPFTKLLASF